MVHRLPPLNALRAFEAAARHLSFKLAAEELCVTPTAVSHQIRGLEAHLGVTLFRRLTRALELTPEGEALLPQVRQGMQCFADAVERVRTLAPDPRLLVLAPPSFASRWLVPRLQRFYRMAPNIELHLAASAATIDRGDAARGHGMDANGRSGDPPRAWIRYGTGRYPGFRADMLFRPQYTAVCSPALLRAKIPLREPADLRRHALIHDDTIPDPALRASWRQWFAAAGVSGVNTETGPHFTDSGLAIVAALDGLGVALLSRHLVEGEVAAGRLSIPFPISLDAGFAYYIVTPEALAEHPPIAIFRDWLLGEVGPAVETDSDLP